MDVSSLVMISSTKYFVSILLRESIVHLKSFDVIVVELTALCADNKLYPA